MRAAGVVTLPRVVQERGLGLSGTAHKLLIISTLNKVKRSKMDEKIGENTCIIQIFFVILQY